MGESCIGRERDGSVDIVDGWETVGNTLGRALLGGSRILRSRAVSPGFQDKLHECDCAEKLCAQAFLRDLQTLGDGTCIASLAGSPLKMHSCWHRFFRTNFINTIVPKNCAPKSCQSFQTLGHGTCIASLAGSETKRAELLARTFQDKFHQRDCPEKLVPKTFQTVSKRWAEGHAGHAWEKVLYWRGFILHGVLSVDAWFSLPLQQRKLNENTIKHRICISVNGQVGK